MSANILVQHDPQFHTKRLLQKDVWETVQNQVTNHTQRKDTNELIDKLRPNEESGSKKYRKENHRMLTKASFTEMYRMFGRIFLESGLSIRTISDNLKDWLSSKPFNYLGQPMDIWEFWFKCVKPQEDEDPNSIMVARPYNRLNPFVAPYLSFSEGGKEKNKKIDVIIEMIPSKQIVFVPTAEIQAFGWYGGKMNIGTAQEAKEMNWYWVVDEFWWYKWIPTNTTNQEKGVVYKLEKWYPHDTGMGGNNSIPVAISDGILTNISINDQLLKYHESHLHAALEYFDEFQARHSDFQVIMSRFAHPKRVVNDDVICMTCKGSKTIMRGGGKNKIEPITCPSCEGTGRPKDISPLGTIYRKSKGLDKGANRPLIEDLVGDPKVLEANQKIIFNYKEKGEAKIGVGLLVDVNESGTAKSIRLQPSEDFLRSVALGSFDGTMKRLLFFVECLLEIDRNKRFEPVINLPATYKLHNIDELTEQSKKTFASNRIALEMQTIEKSYKGDLEMLRLFEIAYAYAPLLSATEEQISNRIDLGSYSNLSLEVLKKDNVIQLLHNFKRETKKQLVDVKDKEIFDWLDQQMDVKEPVEIFEDED